MTTILKNKNYIMLNTDNLLHSYQFSRFKSFSKHEKKARVLKVFSAAKIFFEKPMLGTPNRPIRHIFEFSSPCLLAKIFAKMMPFRLGKIATGGGGGDNAVAAVSCEDFCKLFKPTQKYKIEKIRHTFAYFGSSSLIQSRRHDFEGK